MPVPWWDDARFYKAPTERFQGSVPEEIPREHWSEWDKMTLGGIFVPGHVVVFSKKEKKFDVLSPAGQDGGPINHLGIEPVEMDITITIWTPDQFFFYQQLLNMVIPKAFPHHPDPLLPGVAGPPEDPKTLTAANSIAVQHPPLNMMGVTDIYIHEIGQLIPGPVFGAKVSVWRATERKPDVQTPMLASTDGLYVNQIINRPPVPTQPVTKPSLSAAGPD